MTNPCDEQVAPIIIPPDDPEFDCDCDSIQAAIESKQNKLTAGTGIRIENDVISATGGGGDYQAGVNIDITDNVISAPDVYSKTEVDEALEGYVTVSEMETELAKKQDTLTAGENVQISSGNVISATDTKYTAGAGIAISNNNVISSTVDADVFVPVTELPDASEADDQKIYLTPKTGGGVDEWHVIDVDGTPTWDKFGEADIDISKEHLLQILDMEEVEYTMTECDGTTSTYTVLARKQESYSDEWFATFYSGGFKDKDISVDSIETYVGSKRIGVTRNAIAHTDIDGNGAITFNLNSPTADTPFRIVIRGVHCDGGDGYSYEATAEYVQEGPDGVPVIENVNFTGTGCLEFENIYIE